MEETIDGRNKGASHNAIRRVLNWIHYMWTAPVEAYRVNQESPPDGLGKSHKPPKSYRPNTSRKYSLGSDKIGFTGSVELYKIVREALRNSGSRYEICYLGTSVAQGYRVINVE